VVVDERELEARRPGVDDENAAQEGRAPLLRAESSCSSKVVAVARSFSSDGSPG
jgi:hypothetical protein